MKAATLTAPDISCNHCKATIEKTLGDRPGVVSASVTIPQKQIHLEFDESKISLDEIKEALSEEGYDTTA